MIKHKSCQSPAEVRIEMTLHSISRTETWRGNCVRREWEGGGEEVPSTIPTARGSSWVQSW